MKENGRYCSACKRPSIGTLCERCNRIKWEFCVNPKDIIQLQKDQGYGCAICGKLNGRRALVIDHDHLNGKIRGLLCTKCNLGLGYLESIELLQAAITYLGTPYPTLEYVERSKTPSVRSFEISEVVKIVLGRDDGTSLRGKSRELALMTGISPEAAMSHLRRYQLKLEQPKQEEAPLDEKTLDVVG